MLYNKEIVYKVIRIFHRLCLVKVCSIRRSLGKEIGIEIEIFKGTLLEWIKYKRNIQKYLRIIMRLTIDIMMIIIRRV